MLDRVPALDPGRVALLVIDLQNDFCHEDGFFARAGHDTGPGRRVARQTAALLQELRPTGVEIVFTKSINEDPPTHTLPPRRFAVARDSDAFEEGVGGTRQHLPGTWGVELVSEISPGPSDLVIEKGTYNAFHQTGLEEHLRARNVEIVALAGVNTNACVETTARDAYVRGFDVMVLSDCVAGFGNESHLHEASLETLDLLFGVVASSRRFLTALGIERVQSRVGP